MGLVLFGGAPWFLHPPEVSAFGPVPSGYKALYVFPGLRTLGNAVGVAVHCTNVDRSKDAEIRFEFYEFDATPRGNVTLSIHPGVTATVAADQDGHTAFYAEDWNLALGPSNLDQGAARVLARRTTKIICTAQILDSANNPPSFVYTVPHFSPAGKH